MDEVKDKVKSIMKKVNNPFSSSSSSSSDLKFKGPGRVLGSYPPGFASPIDARPTRMVDSSPKPHSVASVNPKPLPRTANNLATHPKSPKGLGGDADPFVSLITSGKRSGNGLFSNAFQCPVCGGSYLSEEEVSVHIEICVDNRPPDDNGDTEGVSDSSSVLEACVGYFISAKPPEGSVDTVLKLLRNIARDPENGKFRRIRMSNPKIREAVGEAAGCVELLECLGFTLTEEDGETWAAMLAPTWERTVLINKAISLLEPPETENLPSVEEPFEPEKVDRQIRVFFSVPESIAATIQLPDSFYELSLEEVKREAAARKKKIAESQLLIPKSSKEKQVKSAMRKYRKTVIRIQFPDGVVLQGIFSPIESASALYKFVSSALKQTGLEFELLNPAVMKRRVIPRFPPAGGRSETLEEEGLVPSALVRFRPIETDSIVFTGLLNELLEISEPLIVN